MAERSMEKNRALFTIAVLLTLICMLCACSKANTNLIADKIQCEMAE